MAAGPLHHHQEAAPETSFTLSPLLSTLGIVDLLFFFFVCLQIHAPQVVSQSQPQGEGNFLHGLKISLGNVVIEGLPQQQQPQQEVPVTLKPRPASVKQSKKKN